MSEGGAVEVVRAENFCPCGLQTFKVLPGRDGHTEKLKRFLKDFIEEYIDR